MAKTEFNIDNIGKLPPQSIELEESVISILMNYPNAIIRVIDLLKPESFYKEENGKIYLAILELFESNKTIDILTVGEQLRKDDSLDEIGGQAYLSQLLIKTSSDYNLETHAKYVYEKYLAREMIRLSNECTQRSYDNSIDIFELIEYFTREIYELQRINFKSELIPLSKVGFERLPEIFKITNEEKKFTGVPSGFSKLDRNTGGWQKGDLIILAGRPSMGKTILAMIFGIKAVKSNNRIAFFSIEMPNKKIYDRWLSYETGIPNIKFRDGSLTQEQLEFLEPIQAKIEKLDFFIDDSPTLTVSEARIKLLQMKNIDLVVIDYLQLMNDPKASNREIEISNISRGLKAMAKELDIPVIALSQMNRSVENRSDKRPQLSDLRESGAIEQDADIVMFIHRPEFYSDEPRYENLVELLNRKHRNGAIGDFHFHKNAKFTTIEQDEINEELPY